MFKPNTSHQNDTYTGEEHISDLKRVINNCLNFKILK